MVDCYRSIRTGCVRGCSVGRRVCIPRAQESERTCARLPHRNHCSRARRSCERSHVYRLHALRLQFGFERMDIFHHLPNVLGRVRKHDRGRVHLDRERAHRLPPLTSTPASKPWMFFTSPLVVIFVRRYRPPTRTDATPTDGFATEPRKLTSPVVTLRPAT